LPPDVIILRLKHTKFDFGCGSAQYPAGELTAPYLDLRDPTSKRRKGGKEREKGRGKGGMGGGRKRGKAVSWLWGDGCPCNPDLNPVNCAVWESLQEMVYDCISYKK